MPAKYKHHDAAGKPLALVQDTHSEQASVSNDGGFVFGAFHQADAT